MKKRHMTLIVLLGSTVIPAAAMAAEGTSNPMAEKPAATTPERRMAHQRKTLEQLEQALGVGKDKAYYRQALEQRGYAITAVNADDPDYLEYEIVKGRDSYEVQVSVENGVATAVDVTTNAWKAVATKKALEDKDYRSAYPTTVNPNAKAASDRQRFNAWTREKTAVEKKLGIGHTRDYYRGAVEKLGYTVTSVNDNDAGSLEMEIVKGDTSYEVDVEFDEKTRKSTAVDVSINLWETDATERAKRAR